MPNDTERTREGRVSRDEETIRSWADRHGAVPVRERGAEQGDRVRLVPERDAGPDHERVEWDAFFSELEDGEQVVVYHGESADERFQVSDRDAALSGVDAEDVEDRLLQGETVTSEVTETSVVESVVVEEVTLESELVDTDVLDQRIVDVELVGREARNCELVATEGIEPDEGFDREAYLAQLDAGDTSGDLTGGRSFEADESFPYRVEVDVDETWTVVRDLVEEFTVESRVADAEVTEADTVEDHDVDVEGLHRSIFEQGLVQSEAEPDRAIATHEVESDVTASDRIRTTVTRERTVEDEVVDRAHLRAEVSGGERRGMERLDTTPLETADGEGVGTAATEEGQPSDTTTSGAVAVDERLEGKTVVNAVGEELGLVSGVEPDRDVLYVDVDPGITERIMAALGWGGADEEDSPLPASAIDRVTDDEVVLQAHEHLSEIGGGARE